MIRPEEQLRVGRTKGIDPGLRNPNAGNELP